MANVLTRADLYQMVWSTPMSQLAKQFEMSDVGLKKICKAAYVPTPTLGYWSKLSSGKRVSKTPLPVLLPFQSQMVYIRERSRYGYVPEPKLTDEQLAAMELPDPPKFVNSLEEAKAKIEVLVPRIAIPAKIKRVHPVAQMLAEAQAKQAAEKYSFHKPKYAHPNGIKVFKALNSLFLYFSSLGFRVKMSGPSSQSLSIDMDGEYHHFRLISLDDPNGVYRKKVVAGKNFGFAWAHQEWRMSEESTYREYEDLTPDVLRGLAIELFVKIESGHRHQLEWRYEREVERKREAIERIERKRAADAKRKRENIERVVARRYELMDEALLLISKADQIRELMEAMDKKIQISKKPISNYRKWRAWAEHQANSIDPRNMSAKRAGRWIEKFSFG
jgi:hypothetical protein